MPSRSTHCSTWKVGANGASPAPEALAGGARALALLPGLPSILLLATDRGLFRSQDHGETWSRLRDAREVVGASVLLARPNGIHVDLDLSLDVPGDSDLQDTGE